MKRLPQNITHAKEIVRIHDAVLIRGDCHEIMPELLGTYDAIIADPPYGIRYDPRTQSGTRWWDVKGIAGDAEPFDPTHLVGLSNTLVLFGANHFASRLPDSRRWFVWDKRPGMKSMSFADCELAWCSVSGPARMIRYAWSGAHRQDERGEHWHPTQKPIAVMRHIIEAVTKPGDVILDPYMGSGTTGIAALQSGRKFIGIEIERRWFAAAKKRLARAVVRKTMPLEGL
ncbi:MAG: DNA methyltransferase [Gemmatimonas sp.]